MYIVVSHCGFNLHFPSRFSRVHWPLIYFLLSAVSSILLPVFIVLFSSSSYKSSLYNLDTILSQIHVSWIVFSTYGLSFHLLICAFQGVETYNFREVQFINVFYIFCFLCIKKLLQMSSFRLCFFLAVLSFNFLEMFWVNSWPWYEN